LSFSGDNYGTKLKSKVLKLSGSLSPSNEENPDNIALEVTTDSTYGAVIKIRHWDYVSDGNEAFAMLTASHLTFYSADMDGNWRAKRFSLNGVEELPEGIATPPAGELPGID
jgi:hypothetical protein